MLKGVDNHIKHITNLKILRNYLMYRLKLFKDGIEMKYLSLKEHLRIDFIILMTIISNSKA